MGIHILCVRVFVEMRVGEYLQLEQFNTTF